MRTIPLQRSLPLHRTHKCATSVLFPKPALRHARQCALEVYGQGSGPLNDLGRTAQKAGSVAWTKYVVFYNSVSFTPKHG